MPELDKTKLYDKRKQNVKTHKEHLMAISTRDAQSFSTAHRTDYFCARNS